MLNNLELIKPLLTFQSEDTYYFLQILQRKKEHAELGRNSNNVKNYYIKSVEHLEHKMSEIIKLCEVFNARAYIRLTPRSYKKTALHHLQKMAGMIAEGNYKDISKSYLSSSGSTNEGTDKRWIVDIDTLNEEYDRAIQLIIAECKPEGNKILANLPSKNGNHIITSPFDIQTFNQKVKEKGLEVPEIHKDNPTNLIIP